MKTNSELEVRVQEVENLLTDHEKLKRLKETEVDKVCSYYNSRFQFFVLDENGRTHIRKLLTKYPALEILSAIDDGFDYYFNKARKDAAVYAPSFNAYDRGCLDKLLEKQQLGKLKTNRDKQMLDLLLKKKERVVDFSMERKVHDLAFEYLLDKLPGILKNKRKIQSDPDHQLKIDIHKALKYNPKNEGEYWEFALTKIERFFSELKLAGFTSEECRNIMMKEDWKNAKELKEYIDLRISEKKSVG